MATPPRDAVRCILQNNLYGLDIDERAAQLAYFSVMMKAVQYDPRFLRRSSIPQPHVFAIAQSNGIDRELLEYFANGDAGLQRDIETIMEQLQDAKEYGSLLTVSPADFGALYARFDQIIDEVSIHKRPALEELLPVVQTAELLAGQYDVVCTNPPYMAVSNASPKTQTYAKNYFPDAKSDLFACFILRCGQLARQNGYQAMITQHAWMFLSSYENLRARLQAVDTINMAHLGARAFDEIGGEVVQTTSFVMRQSHTAGYKGTYCRLVEPNTQQGKEGLFLAGENRYITEQDNFSKIPGAPVAYWASEKIFKIYAESNMMCEYGNLKHGMTTGKNEVCLKYWHEIANDLFTPNANSQNDFEISGCTYVPYNKGGAYQKWYGNMDYVLGYSKRYNEYMDTLGGHRHDNPNYYFKKAITWSLTNSSYFGARMRPIGSVFDVNGMSMFVNKEEDYLYLLSLMCSKISSTFMRINNPTLASQVGDVAKIPVIIDETYRKVISDFSRVCVNETQIDWNTFETSWDFKSNPLV